MKTGLANRKVEAPTRLTEAYQNEVPYQEHAEKVVLNFTDEQIDLFQKALEAVRGIDKTIRALSLELDISLDFTLINEDGELIEAEHYTSVVIHRSGSLLLKFYPAYGDGEVSAELDLKDLI